MLMSRTTRAPDMKISEASTVRAKQSAAVTEAGHSSMRKARRLGCVKYKRVSTPSAVKYTMPVRRFRIDSSERTHGILRHETRDLSLDAEHTDLAGAHADADRDSVSDDALHGQSVSEAEPAVVRQRSH